MSPDLFRKLAEVSYAETASFVELTKIAQLDPAKAFRGADLRGVDFRDDNLKGFDFSGADLRGARLDRVIGIQWEKLSRAKIDSGTAMPLKIPDHIVLCVSPSDDILILPRGATPVDFAYELSSEIGDTCVGAKINGKIVPLRQAISSGDKIEIITAKGGSPNAQWENFVVTGKARQAIRRSILSRQELPEVPHIVCVGVGGAGVNAVNHMIAQELAGVEFIAANTDMQSLAHSTAERRVRLGPHLTQGLGTGGMPEIGHSAAEITTEELARHLDGAHMVFVIVGMGGGTGTGAAPVIAQIARGLGVLTVAVVTKPFDFEGPKRKRLADTGIEQLDSIVDTLVIIPNQKLFEMASERTTFSEAFKMSDAVLYNAVRGLTELLIKPGLVSLNFSDIRTIMTGMGKATMGVGEAEGDDRAAKAAKEAISNPILDTKVLRNANSAIISITGGYDMTLYEIEEATSHIRKEMGECSDIIFGTIVDEAYFDRINVFILADASNPMILENNLASSKEKAEESNS